MRYILLLCLISLPALAQKKQPATTSKYELRGVVTYFFNRNEGDRPDVGTKGYIIKPAVFAALKGTELKYKRYEYEYLSRQYAQMAGRKPLLPEQEDTTVFGRLDKELSKLNAAIVEHPQTIVVTANGEGVFTKKLSPGTYYVLMVSAHQRHDTETERFASMHLEKVVIKNDDVETSAKFDL